MSLLAISQSLCDEVSGLEFALPVTHVYNPLEYAWETHASYLERYGQGTKSVLLFGMNPGPWGMAQNGVPFGEIRAVRDWMGIAGEVHKPGREHPKRPVQGFDCQRSEVSGQRIWGWAEEHYGTADAFFSQFFIANYCPLCFMEESGRNRTPDRLKKAERDALFPPCDRAITATIELLQPGLVVGVGNFAHKRAKAILPQLSYEPRVEKILHPSPANPQANRNWAERMTQSMRDFGVKLPSEER